MALCVILLNCLCIATSELEIMRGCQLFVAFNLTLNYIIPTYKTECACVRLCRPMCVSFCTLGLCTATVLSRSEPIWHVTALYPPDGHGEVRERRLSLRSRAPRAVCTPLQIGGRSLTSD